jgi:hypothetical protein
MVRANSLLYAVYICLIVAILCGALLYLSTLYTQLNTFYNTRESLFIQNQSAVNYAIGNNLETGGFQDGESGINATTTTKSFGLLSLVTVNTFVSNDTVSTTHFAGLYNSDKTCLYLSNFSEGLTYDGEVTLIGDKKLPSEIISRSFASMKAGKLISEGSIAISDRIMPAINPAFAGIFEQKTPKMSSLEAVERQNDSVYFNSFKKETLNILLPSPNLGDVVIKGNFILYARDSIIVGAHTVLEDVILKAPKIIFRDGFTGNVQAFATVKIEVGKDVNLQYPSALCLYNDTKGKSGISIGESTSIKGAVVLFGNPLTAISQNEITIGRQTLLIGDIYCSGKLTLQGSVYGAIYTNRLSDASGQGNNRIGNAVVDISKKPAYYVGIPLFENKTKAYGVIKKVL